MNINVGCLALKMLCDIFLNLFLKKLKKPCKSKIKIHFFKKLGVLKNIKQEKIRNKLSYYFKKNHMAHKSSNLKLQKLYLKTNKFIISLHSTGKAQNSIKLYQKKISSQKKK